MLNADHKGTHIENHAHFNKEHSPTIPKEFPRQLLPKDKCQHVLFWMVACLAEAENNLCGPENKAYYQCKRERDA